MEPQNDSVSAFRGHTAVKYEKSSELGITLKEPINCVTNETCNTIP